MNYQTYYNTTYNTVADDGYIYNTDYKPDPEYKPIKKKNWLERFIELIYIAFGKNTK